MHSKTHCSFRCGWSPDPQDNRVRLSPVPKQFPAECSAEKSCWHYLLTTSLSHIMWIVLLLVMVGLKYTLAECRHTTAMLHAKPPPYISRHTFQNFNTCLSSADCSAHCFRVQASGAIFKLVLISLTSQDGKLNQLINDSSFALRSQTHFS